ARAADRVVPCRAAGDREPARAAATTAGDPAAPADQLAGEATGMSTWTERTIACPVCGADRSGRVALRAHVARAPEVRDDALARGLHRMTCACGATTELRSTFEYSDFERRQLVLVAPVDQLAAWPTLEACLHGAVRRAFELGSLHAQALAT